MRKVAVVNSITLDGVMQGPGRYDEDCTDGFAHGGWANPYRDPVMFEAMSRGMADAGPMLFGRRTYLDFFKVWHGRTDNPYSEVLDNGQKYVASTTLTNPLPWQNSTLLEGDAADAVAALKAQPGKDFVILGSGELVRSLLRRNLVDRFTLLIHPLILGSGRRLFDDAGPYARFHLVESVPTTTGVVMATYELSADSAS